MTRPNEILVLFSGGKDSFLTACRMAEAGAAVRLLFLNNGAVAYEKNVLHGAARLRNKYGDRARYEGAYCTAPTIWRLNKAWSYMPWQELGRKYPAMTNVHVACLHCQTAMWATAIAYAAARNIPAIAAGYKDTDEFCTGMGPWLDRVTDMARRNGVTVMAPLWSARGWGNHEDFGRDAEMVARLFTPQVLEPKCLIGRPAEKPDEKQAADMMRYFDDVIEARAQECIDGLTRIFPRMRLPERCLDGLDYPPPEEKEPF